MSSKDLHNDGTQTVALTGVTTATSGAPTSPLPTPAKTRATIRPPKGTTESDATSAPAPNPTTAGPTPTRSVQSTRPPTATTKPESATGSGSDSDFAAQTTAATPTPEATVQMPATDATSTIPAPTPVAQVVSQGHPGIVIALALVWLVAIVRLSYAWRGVVRRRREECALQAYAAAAIDRARRGRRHLQAVPKHRP